MNLLRHLRRVDQFATAPTDGGAPEGNARQAPSGATPDPAIAAIVQRAADTVRQADEVRRASALILAGLREEVRP